MASGDIWELTHVQTVNGTRLTNVHFYRQESSNSGEDPRKDLADGFEAGLAFRMENTLATGWDSLCYEVKRFGVTGQQFWRQLSTRGPGSVLGESLNAATVVTIAQFTAQGGHTGTGRMYVSGLAIAHENRNNLTTTGLTQMDFIGDESVADIISNGVTFSPGLAPSGLDLSFEPFIISDVRVPLTKLRSRRQSTKC